MSQVNYLKLLRKIRKERKQLEKKLDKTYEKEIKLLKAFHANV